jgi:hypothetical protein
VNIDFLVFISPHGGKHQKVFKIFRNVNLTFLNKTQLNHIQYKIAVIVSQKGFSGKLKQSATAEYCDFFQKM